VQASSHVSTEVGIVCVKEERISICGWNVPQCIHRDCFETMSIEEGRADIICADWKIVGCSICYSRSTGVPVVDAMLFGKAASSENDLCCTWG
jgi:hypothetical protein